MKILFCGGGTAGHITPSLAVAERMLERLPNSDIAFIGRTGGSENAPITARGYALYTLDVEGFSRKKPFKNIKTAQKIRNAKIEAKKIISDFRPDAIFATGGYVSFPGLSVGIGMKIPTFLHESNSVSGAVCKLLSRKCTAVLVGAAGNTKLLSLKNAIYTGNPTLRAFSSTDRKRAREKLGISNGEILIVSVGGSLGAQALNDAIIGAMRSYSVKAHGIKHIHATGRRYYESIAVNEPELVRGYSGCKIIPYIEDMATYLSAADIAIARAGAMTLAELSVCEVPAIAVPSPNVSADHQSKNALEYERIGAVKIVNEGDALKDNLANSLKMLCEDRDLRVKMQAAYARAENKNATDKIIDIILKTVKQP